MPSINKQSDQCDEADYRRMFAVHRSQFKWLCHALTGDESLAQRSFDTAFEHSLTAGNRAFRDWMLGWIRRVIVKSCIATMGKEIQRGSRDKKPQAIKRLRHPDGAQQRLLKLSPEFLLKRLLCLDVFARFVFVLQALEGYSIRDTALLLDATAAACDIAYLEASARILSWPGPGTQAGPGVPAHPKQSIFDKSDDLSVTSCVLLNPM